VTVPDPTSRYAGLPQIETCRPDGSVRTFLAPRVASRPTLRGAFVVRAGVRLDLLGAAATGESTRWWLIADANPWPDATRLERPGEVIALPDV
jgi:hypothetical protein